MPNTPARKTRTHLTVNRWLLCLCLLAGIVMARSAASQALFQIRTTDLNRVGFTLSNYGFFGNNFISRTPSCEYPLGLGYEHMSRAGLWVGGLAITPEGEAYRVTTGAIDNSQASNQSADTEWAPDENGILERSTLINNQAFHPDAVSEQDFVCTYRDVPGRNPTGINGEDHVPLGVRVDQEIYSFTIEPASHFVVLHFTITNEGNLLRDVHVGLYSQMVSGDKNAYSRWPPSASGGPGSWYRKHYVDYVASLRMARERICLQPFVDPDPEDCRGFEQVPFWAGSKLLGVKPDSVADKRVAFRVWNWGPQDTTRNTDSKRFELMARYDTTTGMAIIDPPSTSLGVEPSPIEMLTVGPFDILPPDSSITVDFAFVFGASQQELAKNADFAQFAFDLDFKLPQPPPSPRLHARPGENHVTLLWDASPERASDDTSPQPGGIDFQGYRVYFGTDRNNLPRVAQWDIVDSTSFNTGFASIKLPQPEIINGDTLEYGYRIDGLRDGFTYFASVTSVDTGDEQVPPLESGVPQNKILLSSSPEPESRSGRVTVYPNPYKVDAIWDAGSLARDQYLWFANLPRRCKIKIYSLAGDMIFETEFDGDSYVGANARGFYDPNVDLDVDAPELSGGSFAWNLITREGQAAVTGLYLYSVSDHATGEIQRGKFLILKSDREGF